VTGAHIETLGELLVQLASALPTGAFDPVGGTSLRCDDLDLELPLEARLEHGAELHATLPRGRLATGFDPPLGRLVAHFEVTEP
jgi:hypothetical protein